MYVVGDEIEEIYETITVTPTNVTDAIKVIKDQITPNERKDSAILRFRKLKQISGETIDSYVDRLRVETKRNNITDTEDNIRLQLITGAFSNRIRMKAEVQDVALKELIVFARTVESQQGQNHVNQPNKQESMKEEHVNQVQRH